MVDLQSLRSELINDPAGLGYAAMSHSQRAEALNSDSGPGAGRIARKSVPNSDPAMRAMLGSAWLRVRLSSDPQVKQDYNTLIVLVGQLGSVSPGDPATQEAIAKAIADGIITQQQAASVTSRIGSRAEVLWGDGVKVGWEEVAMALKQE